MICPHFLFPPSPPAHNFMTLLYPDSTLSHSAVTPLVSLFPKHGRYSSFWNFYPLNNNIPVSLPSFNLLNIVNILCFMYLHSNNQHLTYILHINLVYSLSPIPTIAWKVQLHCRNLLSESSLLRPQKLLVHSIGWSFLIVASAWWVISAVVLRVSQGGPLEAPLLPCQHLVRTN